MELFSHEGKVIGAIFGQHQDNTLQQLRNVAQRAIRASLMADGHLGYGMPVGGVTAYPNAISVGGVGFDIGCGNAAIKTNLKLYDISHRALTIESIEDEPGLVLGDKRLYELANQVRNSISFGLGRTNKSDDAPVNHALFDDPAWGAVPDSHRSELIANARSQLGTVGSGNHYVDIFVDQSDNIWVGVHFGSRGFGHTVATAFFAVGHGGRWGDRAPEAETILDLDSEMGQEYWALMQLAGEYAYVGREWVARKIVELLGGKEKELVHNHHNFAWREVHGDETMVVVRKGATPAWPGQKGFIGGSMGDDAVIVQGSSSNSEAQKLSLYSTVHGAGRVMSRTEAGGKINRRTGQIKRPGKVSPEMMQEWVRGRGVLLRGGGLDESPHAYRRLPNVLKEQGDTIEVLHVLRPIIVAMAGATEFDPYKD